MSIKIRHLIRKANEQDLNFIRKTWLDSFNRSNCNHVIHDALYYEFYRPIVNTLIDGPTLKLISADEEDPTNILSYIVCDPTDQNILHYGFTKTWFRKLGLFWELIQLAFDNDNPIYLTFCTHDFISVKKHLSDKLNDVRSKGDHDPKGLSRWFWYNPFHIYQYLEKGRDYGKIDYGTNQAGKREDREGI